MGLLNLMKNGDLANVTVKDCNLTLEYLKRKEESETGFCDKWLEVVDEAK